MAPLKITFFDGSPGVRGREGGRRGQDRAGQGLSGWRNSGKQVIAALGLPGSEVVDKYCEISGN